MQSPYMSPIERVWFYSLRILCGLILLFLILPVLVIIPLSFNSGVSGVPAAGVFVALVPGLLCLGRMDARLKNSIIVAPAATVLAMVFGTLAAIGLTRGDFPGKALVMALVISPMVVPVVIIGVASYLFFAPLGLGNSFFSLIVVHAVLGRALCDHHRVGDLAGLQPQPGASGGQPGGVAVDRVSPGDAAADCAGRHFRGAVCLCHIVR
jgi:putative spermidine/putrescine transport system permease protein